MTITVRFRGDLARNLESVSLFEAWEMLSGRYEDAGFASDVIVVTGDGTKLSRETGPATAMAFVFRHLSPDGRRLAVPIEIIYPTADAEPITEIESITVDLDHGRSGRDGQEGG